MSEVARVTPDNKHRDPRCRHRSLPVDSDAPGQNEVLLAARPPARIRSELHERRAAPRRSGPTQHPRSGSKGKRSRLHRLSQISSHLTSDQVRSHRRHLGCSSAPSMTHDQRTAVTGAGSPLKRPAANPRPAAAKHERPPPPCRPCSALRCAKCVSDDAPFQVSAGSTVRATRRARGGPKGRPRALRGRCPATRHRPVDGRVGSTRTPTRHRLMTSYPYLRTVCGYPLCAHPNTSAMATILLAEPCDVIARETVKVALLRVVPSWVCTVTVRPALSRPTPSAGIGLRHIELI